MTIRMIGTGSALPETVMTNGDLSKIMETSDEWIRSRTGICERHLAKEETTVSLSAEAAQRALRNAGVSAQELDFIIVATVTGDNVTPAAACGVQAALGADRAVAFDINGACSGFLFALHTAYAYISLGIYKTGLIIGAEVLSRIMDWSDRSTCVLFGDGAGAAVVRQDVTGLLAFDQGSDGARGESLCCKGRPNNNPLVSSPYTPKYVTMDGQEVYKFAVTAVPASIEKTLERAGLTCEDITWFVLHQANIRILNSVARRLRVDMERFPVSLDHCGNVSAASVPILLDEMNQKGMLKKGDRLVLSGFGAGLTWGTCVVEW